MEREVLRCFDHRNRVKYFKYFMNPNNNFKRAVFTKRKELAKVFTDPEAKCPECGQNRWWLLPMQSATRREGGKLYIECLNCGYTTYL